NANGNAVQSSVAGADRFQMMLSIQAGRPLDGSQDTGEGCLKWWPRQVRFASLLSKELPALMFIRLLTLSERQLQSLFVLTRELRKHQECISTRHEVSSARRLKAAVHSPQANYYRGVDSTNQAQKGIYDRGALIARPFEFGFASSQSKLRWEPALGFSTEVRADLCMARVWGDGYGRQCPRHPRSGTQLCGLHKEGLLAHGRVDEPVPPAKLKQMEEAVMKSRGQPKVSESRSPPVASSTAVTRGRAAMQESEIDMSGSNFTWLSDGEEEPAMRPFMRTVGKRSRRRHHRVEYLSGHEVSFVLEVGDVVRAFRGKGGLVCGEICELVEDGQRKFMVLRRMYEAAELRKGSARPTLSEKELVASEKCEELPLSSLAGRPLRVLSQKAYTKEADEEDINIQATGCMFCRRLLGEGDVLWELDWDKDREKKREECLRAYRGLEKKEAQGKLPDGPQGIFFMALSALRPFASEGMLPCRESEQASVMEFLKSSLRIHIKKEVLYVSGMPGTGKTASVLDAAKRLEKARSSSSNSNTPIKFAYVNAMCLSTPSAVFAEIQRKVLGQAQKRKRGPGPGGDGEEALRQALTQAGGEVVILVIDEVDALLTQGQTVLYRLFDWMSQPNARLVVVAIANTMDLPERLLPRVSSRLGIRRVNFEAYNRDQLHTILADRLRAGGAEAAIRDD
ncbi:orcA, partial [Symbiodinium necroappetens]